VLAPLAYPLSRRPEPPASCGAKIPVVFFFISFALLLSGILVATLGLVGSAHIDGSH
jgi:hypothetical protein